MSDDSGSAGQLDPERVFVASSVFPEASAAFGARESFDSAFKKADVVLDTNVLLLPYSSDPNSLDGIVGALKNVRDESRLFIPGQVAREFVRNRPKKLGELLQALNNMSGGLDSVSKSMSYPMLEGLDEYGELQKRMGEFLEARAKLVKSIRSLRRTVFMWEDRDPVSQAYSSLFVDDCVLDLDLDQDELISDLERRFKLSIPPGYKDSTKDDGGVGDLIIWKTILDLGSRRKNPVVFVTGDDKADWKHQTNKEGFMPRFELVDEFRRASGGGGFYMLSLSRFLALMDATEDVVNEIREEEVRSQISTELVHCPVCNTSTSVELSGEQGSSSFGRCPRCDEFFHVHRVDGSVVVRERGESRQFVERELVGVKCPYCEVGPIEVRIGRSAGDTAFSYCTNCTQPFNSHRSSEGTVFSRRSGRYFGRSES